MPVGELTSPEAVELALAEFDELGRDAFLAKYGFGRAKRWYVERDGRLYDSKAIVGVAIGYQHPQRGPMSYNEFSGGEGSVKARLEALGFTLVDRPDGEEPRQAWLFQANPNYYDIDRALRELPVIEWTVRGHIGPVHTGDRAYIWRSGRQGGVVAVGTVMAEPAESAPSSADRPYWREPDRYGFDKVEARVPVRVDRIVEPPLLRTALRDDPVLSNLMVIRAPRGTVYDVPREQELRLEELLAGGQAQTGAGASDVAPPQALPTDLEELHQQLGRKRQVILQGPPGVGKTFTARRYISWLARGNPERARLTSHLGALPEDERTVEALVNQVESSGLRVVWDIVQFHPSYTYEDFIRGLVARPLEQGITFEARNKLGGLMAAVARVLREKGADTRAVLVIDEINRGDISKIFGELIYALEYRDQPVASPYSVDGHSEIVIPSNLDFIGTMNTADRSIALVDYALRRRFVFLDIQPDRHVIEEHAKFSGRKDREAALWLFDQIAAIFSEAGLQELQVGHSYFLLEERPQNGDAGCEALATRFGYEVFPLLLEYEAEGRFERKQLDVLLNELGTGDTSLESRPRQREMTRLVAARLKSEPWRT